METKVSRGENRYIDGSFCCAGGFISDGALWQILLNNDTNCHCQFAARVNPDGEQKNDNGIVDGHAYSIITCREVEVSTDQVFRLLKMRNPWGKFEWKGDWSDYSAMWDNYPAAEIACELEQKDDGVFWICLEDFTELFNLVESTDVACEQPRFDELEKLRIEEERAAAANEEPPEELDEAIQLFAEIDGDGDGTVSVIELWEWLWNMGMWWVSRRDARLLLESLDTNGSGKLSLDEIRKIQTVNPLEWEIQRRIAEAGGKSRKVASRRKKSWFRRAVESVIG